MSQISGIASLLFITMAFVTSCGPNQTPGGDVTGPLVTLAKR